MAFAARGKLAYNFLTLTPNEAIVPQLSKIDATDSGGSCARFYEAIAKDRPYFLASLRIVGKGMP
jgi:hypothetical protein